MGVPLQVVVPSFMISGLRRAFEIGFMLFLPFLIIDLVGGVDVYGCDDATACDDLPTL